MREPSASFDIELFKHRVIHGIRSSIAVSQMALSKAPSTRETMKDMDAAQEYLDKVTDLMSEL